MVAKAENLGTHESVSLWRYLAAGVLAGVCIIVTFMGLIALLLYTGALWQYGFNSQIPVIQDTAWLAVMQDVGRMPSFFWSGRWLMVGMAAIGGLLALLDRFVQRYPIAWRNSLASIVVYVLVGTVVLSGILGGAEQALANGGDESASIASLAERQPSIWISIIMGVIVTFALGGTSWGYWRWWYAHWRRWLGAVQQGFIEAVQPSAEELFANRGALQRANRLLNYGLAGSIVVLIAAATIYSNVRMTVQSGELWVEPAAPQATLPLTITRPAHYLFVENTYGVGSARLSLVGIRDDTPLTSVAEIAFGDSHVRFDRTSLGIADLPPGNYRLRGELGSGVGGRVGYALMQGSGFITQVAALFVGLGSGLVLALIVVIWGIRMEPGGRAH